MPNRIIRDSILDSERYLSLTHHVERLLFYELILLADDYGLVPLGQAFLARRTTACGGMSGEQCLKVISALADVDLIRVFNSQSGSRFAYMPRFGNSPRSAKPKWPIPPDAIGGNEIKDLQQKRIANAKHMHSARIANAPETETETETETEEKKRKTTRAPRTSPPIAGLEGVSDQVVSDWIAHRKAKRAAVTATAIRGIQREADKAGVTLESALSMCCQRGWTGFKADWAREAQHKDQSSETPWQRGQREKMAAAVPGIAARAPGRVQVVIDMEEGNGTRPALD